MTFRSARGRLRLLNHHNKGWGCQTVLGFVWGQQGYFHMHLLCVSAASFHIIGSQHDCNPNISPRFECQTSFTISDKNNGLLQAESQVSEHWINTRQQCFLSREDDQGGLVWGQRISSLDLMTKCSLDFPCAPLLCYHSEITAKTLTQIN